MISTVTQICNLALSRIGARRLSSYESDTTMEAVSCRLHYDLARDGLLRRHQWDFAKRSVKLSRLAADPLSEYAAAWQMPSDCVRIIRISTGVVNRPLQQFERRDRQLLTQDFSALELVYVSNTIQIDHWDSLFIEAISLRLASKICEDIAQNPAKMQEIQNELEALSLPTAQTADAREANSGEGFGLSALIGQSVLARGRRRGRSMANLEPYADIP